MTSNCSVIKHCLHNLFIACDKTLLNQLWYNYTMAKLEKFRLEKKQINIDKQTGKVLNNKPFSQALLLIVISLPS